ncbi:MAG: hypothetical protein GXP37_05655 [Chloroflexi bacterium]|nr:hypothetical protein [Chloroflexota bacterium]
MSNDDTTPRPDSGPPHPVLTGLTAGLLLFGLTLCTLTLWFIPALSRQINIAGVTGPRWSPPTATPVAPRPTPTPSPDLLPTTSPTPAPAAPVDATFHVGDIAINVNDGPVNLRRTPGYRDKAASDRIALVPEGARVEILAGPASADELVWWRVRWQGQQGWMAEMRVSGGPILKLAP